jgi:cell wall-associated NlpC family hydrolase
MAYRQFFAAAALLHHGSANIPPEGPSVDRTTHLSRAVVVTAVFAGSLVVALPLSRAGAQQSDLSVSPFVSFLPATGASPLAGLGLTLAGNGGLALRASGHLSLDNQHNSTMIGGPSLRPWGADADAVLFLGGRYMGTYRRTLAPFVFAGVGVSSGDSVGSVGAHNNWSYGAGLTVPVGSAIDLFGESRWRMSRFVLPTAQFASSPTTELRFGLSFHVGGGWPAGAAGSDRRSDDRRREAVMFPVPERYPTPSPAASASASRVLRTAEEYIGTPYRYGGTSPSSGFDCSGFTQYVFAKQGVRLPRTAHEQAVVGAALPTDWSAVVPGDLVMFEENGQIGHVAIYAGNNRIIHSSSSGRGVRYDDLGTQRGEWFVDHMVAARRVTPDARGLMLDLAKGFAATKQLDGPDHAPKAR